MVVLFAPDSTRTNPSTLCESRQHKGFNIKTVGSHHILMIITSLVVILLLLPYVLLLICARPIRRTRVNECVQPLLEAIHAPYKEGKEYCFVA